MKVKRGETLTLAAPMGATALRIAGAGKLATVNVSEGSAVVDAATTAQLPAGVYGTEWAVADADGRVRLPDGPRLLVVESLSVDELRDSPVTERERVLAAARKALETAAVSGEIGFTVQDASFTFESRAELLAFVRGLELRLAHERGLPKRRLEFTL